MRLTILLVIFGSLLQSCSDSASKNQESISKNSSEEPPAKYTAEEKSSILDGMKTAMSNFSGEKSVRDLDDAKSQLQSLGFAWYQSYGQLIEAKADSAIWKLRDSAISVFETYQKKMFPKYRKALAEETDKKLWIEDCSAYISGDNDDILNLVGLTFALNRNKQESYEALQKVLKQYRFKKVTFRTFKSSDDVTVFDITSDDDKAYISMVD